MRAGLACPLVSPTAWGQRTSHLIPPGRRSSTRLCKDSVARPSLPVEPRTRPGSDAARPTFGTGQPLQGTWGAPTRRKEKTDILM